MLDINKIKKHLIHKRFLNAKTIHVGLKRAARK